MVQILKNAGTYEILRWPENISQIGDVARTCYQSFDKGGEEEDRELVRKLLARKHMPMIEFDDMIVRFDLVSRGFTHEMVRHRLCSFAQESTRYVDESDFQVVVPGHRDEVEWIVDFNLKEILGSTHEGVFTLSLQEWFALNEHMYQGMRKAGWPCEDARQVLPIAIKSQIVVKANLREWRHIFAMRTSKFAHWEIRRVMCNLLHEVKLRVPLIFDDFEEVGVLAKDGSRYFRMVDSKIEEARAKIVQAAEKSTELEVVALLEEAMKQLIV